MCSLESGPCIGVKGNWGGTWYGRLVGRVPEPPTITSNAYNLLVEPRNLAEKIVNALDGMVRTRRTLHTRSGLCGRVQVDFTMRI